MSQFLKQNTAGTLIMFGVFVDKGDGVTLKTDATTITDIDHATTGIFLSKNGAAAVIRHQGVTASVADSYGMMKVTLDATDTNTVGTLDVLFAKAATYLPVHKSFMVLPANVYDSLMGTDLLDVNAAQWLGTAILAPGTAGTPDVNAKLIGATTQTGNDIGADVNDILVDTAVIGALGAGLTAIPWNATWDAEVESECQDALILDNLDHLCKTVTGGTDMTTEIADNTILSRVLANGDTSVFDPSTDGLQPVRDQIVVIDDFVDTEVASIKTVTDKVDTALVLDGAVYQFTANALELAPTGGGTPPTAGAIADAVWNEAQADHEAAGSFGELQWLGNNQEITNNQQIGKGASGNVLKTFNLTRDGSATEFNPDKKEAI